MKNRHFWQALASFFIVGLGQIIKGEGEKGLRLILLFYFVLPMAVYLALMFNDYLFFLTLGAAIFMAIILWSYNIWDALTHAPVI
jgi:hypothetical protein